MPIRLVFLFSHSICLRNAVVSRHLDESSKWDDHFKVMYVRHQIKIRTVRHLSSFDRHESWMHICARLIVKMQRNMIWLRNVNFHHQKREREERMLNRKKCAVICVQPKWKKGMILCVKYIYICCHAARHTGCVFAVWYMHACFTSMTFDSVAPVKIEYACCSPLIITGIKRNTRKINNCFIKTD